MQLTKMKTLMEPASGKGGELAKVTAMAWSPNNKRLAVVTVDRTVHLFNELGERRDKFSTKAAEKGGPKNYLVRGLAWSPDSTRLAVAQSDNIVFVYKLGLEWGAKKSIVNKFHQKCPVTCITWLHSRPHDLVFGAADGKVKVGQLRENKPATLYSSDSYVVSCAGSPDGKAVVTGHLDGAIYRYFFEDPQSGGASSYAKFCVHPCPPYALAWVTGANCILAAGNDERVVFYDSSAGHHRMFDYTSDDGVKEFTVAECNPSGQSVVVGNFNQFFVYAFDTKQQRWNEIGPRKVDNYYSVTSLAWKRDGSRVTVGTLCGYADMYDACVKRCRYKNTFEFTYVSPSQVIVKRISTGERMVLKSMFSCEITKINIYADDTYLVANTDETLLCGELETCKLSEVPWNSNGQEKYVFDNPSVCMVYTSGELTLIEYGRNEILGSVRTEHMRPTLVSVRINERPPRRLPGEEGEYGAYGGGDRENKKIAHILDPQTVRIVDLTTGYEQATVNHDSKIDWLELNARADMLLYRDKRRQLHLYNIHKQSHTTLLTYCNYAQWVPESDVVVGQNRGNLCVWYNIEAPEKVTIIPIQGEVEEIERVNGKTEVRVDNGMNTLVYGLDEALIGYGSAVEDGHLSKAMRILEEQTNHGQDMRDETEAMWKQLSDVAFQAGELAIAERCYAAIGDVSKARYIRRVYKTMKRAEEATGNDGRDHWLVRAKLAQLTRDFKDAELIFTEQGQVDEAVEMYQVMHKWEEAIRVAEQRNHPDAADMKQNYFDYLLSSGQEEKAAAMKELEGEYLEAIELFLRGGRPAKALTVVNSHNSDFRKEVLDRIATALTNSKMHDKAGELFERMHLYDQALEAYIKGHAFRNAVELSRREFPAQVVRLEEAWGDWLVANKATDTAIHHFIEAGASRKAIEAALSARLWNKASQLVDTLQASDGAVTRPYYKRIAKHYHQAGQHKQAESYYCLAGAEKEAIEMYTEVQKWDAAHKLALRYMSKEEVTVLYTQQAQALQAKGKFREAERQLLAVDEVDHAITMYKKARMYDDMIRLVGTYRKQFLKETHLHLAQQLEMESQFKESEDHYAQAGEWQSAVNMYRNNDMWDEAMRVAKFHGGMAASNRVGYAWAMALGGQEGIKLLQSLGLIKPAIDYALDIRSFDYALELAESCMPSEIPEVHLKHALALEDEEKFAEAEAAFIRAEKPKEAIEMYSHQQDWVNASRVAEQYDPPSMSVVLVAQGQLAAKDGDFERSEALFLNAKKPEGALAMYEERGMWPEAIRFAKRNLPHLVEEVVYRSKRGGPVGTIGGAVNGSGAGKGTVKHAFDQARMWEEAKNFDRAIDEYLSLSAPQITDMDVLENAWERAVRLASKNLKERYHEVAEEVAVRLFKAKRYTGAAELFKDIDKHKEAIECYIEAGKWTEAKQHASTVAPAYIELVDKAHTKFLVGQGAAGKLEKIGKIGAALDLYAEQRRWDDLFDTVDKEDDVSIGAKYAGEYAAQLLSDVPLGGVSTTDVNDAVAKLSKYGSPNATQFFSLYCRLAQEVLGRSESETSKTKAKSGNKETEAYEATLSHLRKVLFKAIGTLSSGGNSRHESKSSGGGDDKRKTLERLLLATHLYLMHLICLNNNLEEMAANLLVGLLRFAGDVPCDKIFYLAGQACRTANWTGKGFVMLNHYLDLSEAIDNEDMGLVDNMGFAKTDLPTPYDYPLPKTHYLVEDKREELRDWVLGAAMDDVEQTPVSMDWLSEVRMEIGEQIEHLVRRFDREALPIEESLRDVREMYLAP